MLDLGGPALLVQTIQDLTHVQIDHYARIDFTHADRVVNAMGGVDVRLPDRTDGFGHVFHIGIDDLNGRTALDYARERNLPEEDRVLRQESLMRAVVRKLVQHHLLSNPLTDYQEVSIHRDPGHAPVSPVAGCCRWRRFRRRHRQPAFPVPAQCR